MRVPAHLSLPALAVAVALALNGCSSDDDDGAIADGETTQAVDPATSGPADTSELAPDSGDTDVPVSSAPGGDASAVAGLWDASADGAPGSYYVSITDDGTWTRYTLDEDGSNCFDRFGPFTLTPEGGTDYSLAGVAEALDLERDGDVLNAVVPEIASTSWPLVDGEIDVPTLDGQDCAAG